MELKLGDRDAFERFSDDLLEGREVGVRVVGVMGVVRVVGGRGSLYGYCGCNFMQFISRLITATVVHGLRSM